MPAALLRDSFGPDIFVELSESCLPSSAQVSGFAAGLHGSDQDSIFESAFILPKDQDQAVHSEVRVHPSGLTLSSVGSASSKDGSQQVRAQCGNASSLANRCERTNTDLSLTRTRAWFASMISAGLSAGLIGGSGARGATLQHSLAEWQAKCPSQQAPAAAYRTVD